MPIPAAPYTTYQQILTALREGSMTVVGFIGAATKAAAAKPSDRAAARSGMTLDQIVRAYVVLAAVVRRSIVFSRHLATLPVPVEQREGRIMPMLDRVFGIFAEHKIDLETFHKWIDDDADAELDGLDDLAEPRVDGDVAGRRPITVIAELCRDFGIAIHALPPEWLEPVSPELRLLCARAAAAALRPSAPAKRVGHLLER